MASFWSQPRQISRLLGPATFLLDDGSRWHASRLRKVPAPLSEHLATARAQSPFPCNAATDPGPPPALVATPAAPRQEVVVPDPRPSIDRTCYLGEFVDGRAVMFKNITSYLGECRRAVLPFSAPAHHLPAHHLPAAAAPQAGRGDCLDAHRACGSDPRCEALYRGVELCADEAGAGAPPLGEQAASECLESQDALLARHPALLACRCQRGSRREERCLHVYWSVRLLPGEDEMEVSPYEMMPMDTHMASLIAASSSSLPQDGLNACLKAAQDCGLFEKCGALRSEYVLACTKRPSSGTDRCNRQKCHRALRRFLERVPEEYSLGVLFCPCGEPLCGERRRKTIVPSCSYLERDGPPPNCLHLQSYCRRDDLCRSRLADFLHSCQASSMSSSGCVRDTSAGLCLRAYAGLIGTMMTPNYVSNSSADVALWCNCEGSGNQWQDCLRLQRMFTHNPCLSE
ncbi:unnamed protein product [Boreogadus saida]